MPAIFASIATNNIMITDIQLMMFANFLGISLFLLVVLYHYIEANSVHYHVKRMAHLSASDSIRFTLYTMVYQ
ncbi:hypothetical protein GE061_012410 [Apolygus lucorum]|uniref:Dolichyl-diphosphooligosaccharide--protein glycosyltransferase subunit 4 n=1 Tax=Apolygus lucorum TaxID=248454 RepID=A0A8S9XSG2_APOLU|nr:hypothetical protein GE061_012410 [Apolygus lucorum]